MTQLRHDPDNISNYFDKILEGIGHRGSSFMDVDAVSHDLRTKRFLVQEFKRKGERLNIGQRRTLGAFAEIPAHFTVWVVVKRDDGLLDWIDWGVRRGRVITIEEYRGRFKAWWDNVPIAPVHAAIVLPPVIQARVERELLDTDITWG